MMNLWKQLMLLFLLRNQMKSWTMKKLLQLHPIISCLSLTISGTIFNGSYNPDDSFVIGDLKWTIQITTASTRNNARIKLMNVSLECNPHERTGDYEITAECQLSLESSRGYKYPSRFACHNSLFKGTRREYSGQDIYNKPVYTTCIDNRTSLKAGEFFWDLSKGAYNEVLSRNKNTFAINFKTLKVEWKEAE
uniref:MATH domain-containing protein n=1 Tax=Cacopsylla melanoneura TaxID=428564 RepID=A0A8D8YD61_9HEMI